MFGVVANITSDRVLRTGAKVWIEALLSASPR